MECLWGTWIPGERPETGCCTTGTDSDLRPACSRPWADRCLRTGARLLPRLNSWREHRSQCGSPAHAAAGSHSGHSGARTQEASTALDHPTQIPSPPAPMGRGAAPQTQCIHPRTAAHRSWVETRGQQSCGIRTRCTQPRPQPQAPSPAASPQHQRPRRMDSGPPQGCCRVTQGPSPEDALLGSHRLRVLGLGSCSRAQEAHRTEGSSISQPSEER